MRDPKAKTLINMSLIREADEQPEQKTFEAQPFPHDSLDAQMDDLILDAITGSNTDDMNEGLSLRFLLEADDEEDAAAEPAPAPAAPAKQLDVQSFAGEVASMITHADTLLDVRGTILRRVLNHVAKNYDENTMKSLQDILMTEFEISVDRHEPGDEDPELPIARGAGNGAPGG